MKRSRHLIALALLAVLGTLSSPARAQGDLPDPDGEPADMDQPVQVFILMGQSNMLGFGTIAGADNAKSLENATRAQGLYPYLVDDDGNWTTRMDVRNVFIMASGHSIGNVRMNNWLTIQGRNVGPEIGIGHHLGNAIDAPVLVLKSCIGNRSLGWDLLPPGSEAYEHGGQTIAGYRGTGDDPTGDTEGSMEHGWYAGCQYDGDVASAKSILEQIGTYYPGATEYEVAGFFYWQGDKDRYNAAHAARYELNLVRLIHALRNDFEAPNAPFVCATLGQTQQGAGGNDGLILNAQMAVSDPDRHPDFEGNVATVYTHPLSMGGASNGHYGGDARTYMNVGQAMGAAMVELLGTTTEAGPSLPPVPDDFVHEMRTWTSSGGQTLTAKFISTDGRRVVLELENGRQRQYRPTSFSEEDQEYIARFAPRE